MPRPQWSPGCVASLNCSRAILAPPKGPVASGNISSASCDFRCPGVLLQLPATTSGARGTVRGTLGLSTLPHSRQLPHHSPQQRPRGEVGQPMADDDEVQAAPSSSGSVLFDERMRSLANSSGLWRLLLERVEAEGSSSGIAPITLPHQPGPVPGPRTSSKRVRETGSQLSQVDFVQITRRVFPPGNGNSPSGPS